MIEWTSKFEGPEKKLEIILSSPQYGLRSNQDGRWDRVVNASHATVISRISNRVMDAYLLSESSLFVWDDRILMITCGKTTLVDAVPELLQIVNGDRIAFVFYERKSFMFPQEQPSDFEDDVAKMLVYFPGKSYRLGPANDDHIHVFYATGKEVVPKLDVTLQLLMHELSSEVMDTFILKNMTTTEQIEKQSGVSDLFTQATKDSYLFYPSGYSLNGIFEKNYFTIHVTPQTEGSYVSFETNVIARDFSGLISQVLAIFRPGRFSLVLTTTLDAGCFPLHDSVGSPIAEYVISEKSMYEFNHGYAVTFLNFVNEFGPH